MKKLLISLLLGATILTTGCTQAKEIGEINNIENKIEENITSLPFLTTFNSITMNLKQEQ